MKIGRRETSALFDYRLLALWLLSGNRSVMDTASSELGSWRIFTFVS